MMKFQRMYRLLTTCLCVFLIFQASSQTIGNKELIELSRVQHNIKHSIPYANSVSYARSVANKHRFFTHIEPGDTVFLLERTQENGGDMIVSYLWSNRRKYVLKYVILPRFEYNTIPYTEFNDPLRLIAEKMDTSKLHLHTSPIGAPSVFISNIHKKSISSYCFFDIYPILYDYK